jgi:aspartate racemase
MPRLYFLEGADLGGPHNHPEIPMHSHPLAEYVNCICANGWGGRGRTDAFLLSEAVEDGTADG